MYSCIQIRSDSFAVATPASAGHTASQNISQMISRVAWAFYQISALEVILLAAL